MLIDKPVGWTSHDVVAVVRRELGTRSVGHAGTLDPFATGLLVVLVGTATRLARFVEGGAKRYEAVVRFGTSTDTDDGTGMITREVVPPIWPAADAIRDALAGFGSGYAQRPPAFSAKHVAGTRSYALARRGVAVELAPVQVTLHRLAMLSGRHPTCASRRSSDQGPTSGHSRATGVSAWTSRRTAPNCGARRSEGLTWRTPC